MRYLRDDEIPPAAWLRKRFSDFQHTQLRYRFNYPPIHFVFSEKRYMEALEHDMGWKEDLSYTSYIFSPKARALIGSKTEKNEGVRFPVRTDSAVGYNHTDYGQAILETKQMQSELNERVAQGEYIWGANINESACHL